MPSRLVLTVACVAQFMLVLDITIVAVALPDMRSGLGMDVSEQQWVVNAYTLALGGFLLVGGRAADVFGANATFCAGLALFSAASLAGGLAESSELLIAARSLQGIGGAILAPATLTLLTTATAGLRERTRALSWWNVAAAGGGALGLVAGGALVVLFGWRAVMFVNVPVGLVLLAIALRWIAPLRPPVRRRALDLPGAVVATAGMTTFVYAVASTPEHSWASARTLALIAVALALLALFVAIERHAREPLVPLGLFRSRTVSAGNAIAALAGGIGIGWIVLTAVFLQEVDGRSAWQTGLWMLPVGVATAFSVMASRRLVQRYGIRPVLIGAPMLCIAGFIGLAQLDVGASLIAVLGPGMLVGLGNSCCALPMTVAGTTGVPAGDHGVANGILVSSRQVGTAVSLAVLTAVAASHAAHLRDTGAGAADALAGGYGRAFLVGAGLAACVVLIATFLLPRVPVSWVARTSSPQPVPPSTGEPPLQEL